ncbi:hepcidin [Mirounga angustirostris]|uniref:hepcidin n=1 Tax=Mirounga leonina TaxID=9715 RepID=UPI00156C16B4|nr:hepcidin [Mirounga leonina]XP_045746297.1 hepcidin [Mirounga angustirostris]
MAMSMRIQAAGLLSLLLAGLASGWVLPPQTEQLAALQVQDAAGAQAGLMPTLPRLRRRDTHFPICLFCCGCCNKPMCGLCCRT